MDNPLFDTSIGSETTQMTFYQVVRRLPNGARSESRPIRTFEGAWAEKVSDWPDDAYVDKVVLTTTRTKQVP